MNLTSKQIIEKVIKTYAQFKNTKYLGIVNEAVNLCFSTKYEQALVKLDELPKAMLSDLLEKCKGKSVYTNVKALIENKLDNTIDNLKVLSSLKTHCLIEMKEHPEFELLLETIENKYMLMRGLI